MRPVHKETGAVARGFTRKPHTPEKLENILNLQYGTPFAVGACVITY